MNEKKDHRYLSRNLTMVGAAIISSVLTTIQYCDIGWYNTIIIGAVGAVFLAVSEAIDKDEGRL